MMEARRRMDFKYPFPTLKQRAILTVCRQWIDNKLVPQFCDGSSGLVCLECENSDGNLIPAIDRFVDNVPVPKALKVDFYHVLNGLRRQFSQAFTVFFCCANHKIGVHIDNSGRFDYMGFLRCCFKKNLDKDLHILYAMFSFACKACLLPEIDLLLRKIVTKVDGGERDSELLLEQPTHQLTNFAHVVIYRFLHEANASMINRLNEMSSYMHLSKCHANQECISISLHQSNFTIDVLEKHISLLETSSINHFLGCCILGVHCHFGTAYELEIVKYLDQQSPRGWASHFEDVSDRLYGSTGSHYSRLLGQMLDWPFTQFFVPTLDFLGPHVRDNDYCELFSEIVTRILQKEPEYATLHHDLLHSLWSVMPLRLKQDCLDWQRALDDKQEQLLCDIKMGSCRIEYFLKAMLRLKIKAPALYEELMPATFNEQ